MSSNIPQELGTVCVATEINSLCWGPASVRCNSLDFYQFQSLSLSVPNPDKK